MRLEPVDGNYSQEVGIKDFEELDLEELLNTVYTAARHEQNISESPSAITVITREQIENTHCTDVICLLRQVPEVDVRRVLPGFTVVGARAMTEDFGNKTLVMVDGREINKELFGVALWQSLPIHLLDIERIEIIRGPGSALYGANAHSMVVSFVTRKAAEGGAEVFLGGGEHHRSSLHLRLNQPLGDWRLHLSGGIETADNWRIRDLHDREVGRLRLSLDHESDSTASTIQVGLVTPGGMLYSQLAPVQVKDTYMGHLFLSHRTDFWRAQMSAELVDSYMSADMPLYWGEVKLGDFPEIINFFFSNLDAEAQITLPPFEGNLLIAGGNYRWLTFISEDTDPETTHQHRVGLFVHDEQRLGKDLTLTVGLRFDWNDITEGNVSIPHLPSINISPRLAVVWRFGENQFLRLAFGQAFRKPSFYETSTRFKGVKGTDAFPELGEFFRNNIGNPDLGNEKTTSFEVGYRVQLLDNSLTAETGVFYTQYRDIISFQLDIKTDDFGLPDLNTSEMRFMNTGREADSMGGSVSLTYHLKALRLNANYTFRHSWYISEPPGGPTATEGSKGERVPWEPAHLVNLSFHYISDKGPRLGMSLHGHSSCDLAWPEDGSIFGEDILVHSPPAYFVSGFLAWRFDFGTRWAELGVRAFNILNAGFRDLPAVMRPDGVEQGGELIGRRIFLFFRGSI